MEFPHVRCDIDVLCTRPPWPLSVLLPGLEGKPDTNVSWTLLGSGPSAEGLSDPHNGPYAESQMITTSSGWQHGLWSECIQLAALLRALNLPDKQAS